MSDFCTLFPEGLLGKFWGYCCYLHDKAYEALSPRLQADYELGKCVWDSGSPVTGVIMAIGTAAFGWWFYKRKKKKT